MKHFVASATRLFDPGSVIGALILGAIFLVLALLVAMFVRRVARRIEGELSDITVLHFASVFAQLLVYLIAFAIYAHIVPQLHTLGTALLAGAGVTSLIVGLAARDTLGNLIAGVWLVLTKTIRIGDSIRIYCPVGMISAKIQTITLGFSLLIDDDGNEVIVPNNVMMDSAIVRCRHKDSGSPPAAPDT